MDIELQNRLNRIEYLLSKLNEEIVSVNRNQAKNFQVLNDAIVIAIKEAVKDIKG